MREREIKTAVWDGFRGKNLKADEYDLEDTQAIDIRNLHLTAKFGSLVKMRGFHTASLKGETFSSDGLDGDINCLAELIVADSESDSPYYICQAGSDDKFYLWNDTTSSWDELEVDVEVDTDVISTLGRNDAVLFMTGSGENNHPVLAVYCRKTFTNSYKSDASLDDPIDSALVLERAWLSSPTDLNPEAIALSARG